MELAKIKREAMDYVLFFCGMYVCRYDTLSEAQDDELYMENGNPTTQYKIWKRRTGKCGQTEDYEIREVNIYV